MSRHFCSHLFSPLPTLSSSAFLFARGVWCARVRCAVWCRTLWCPAPCGWTRPPPRLALSRSTSTCGSRQLIFFSPFLILSLVHFPSYFLSYSFLQFTLVLFPSNTSIRAGGQKIPQTHGARRLEYALAIATDTQLLGQAVLGEKNGKRDKKGSGSCLSTILTQAINFWIIIFSSPHSSFTTPHTWSK